MSQPTPYDHIVFTDSDGTAGILVDLNTKKYYQLKRNGYVNLEGDCEQSADR